MIKMFVVALVLVSCAFAARAQQEVEVNAVESDGQQVFDRIQHAVGSPLECSSKAGGSWTNAQDARNNIAGEGSSLITNAVPLRYRVEALVTNPPGMVFIPAGSFMMGHATNVFPESEGFPLSATGGGELPQHNVNVRAFYMDRYEVTKALWDQVRDFNDGNGYVFENPGLGKAANHPVNTLSWFDMVKWCNARSEQEGLTPVYYTDAGFTTVYKNGVLSPFPNWEANGYRLPTEAEWEKAARGGAANTRFPWTDYTNKISWAKANYFAQSHVISYDLDGGDGAYHPSFAEGGLPYTSPVGSFPPNDYGLFDMAGNVWEWCWDWYDGDYYSNSPESDPTGPTGPAPNRVIRGGSFNEDARYVRVANRYIPEVGAFNIGFRCVRGF